MRPSSPFVRERATFREVAVSIAETLRTAALHRSLLALAFSLWLAATVSAQQPSAVRTPATIAPATTPSQLNQHAGSSYAGSSYAGSSYVGESAGLRPSMPQEAWTGASSNSGTNAAAIQTYPPNIGADNSSAPPTAESSPVQFAGYAEPTAQSAPSVYSAGANQRVGSVTAVPPTESPAAAQPKERRRIPIAEKSGDASTATKSSSAIRPLLSMVFSLLIVLGLFFGMVWVYRKSSNNASHSVPKQVVQVLGRTPLAARQNLVLVRFGSKLLLVSMAQGETRTLGEITDPLEVDQLAGLCESNSPNSLSNSFRNILSQGVQA